LKLKFLYFPFLVSLIATLGSLFFSVVMNLPPCNLCWFQRVFMYPLIYTLSVAILTQGQHKELYSLGLAVMGLVVSFYHNLIYYGIITEPIIPCTSGISCSAKQIEWLGFVSIPLLSLIAFVLIVISLTRSLRSHQ
jgi:disulfide bond formation protein DsbB